MIYTMRVAVYRLKIDMYNHTLPMRHIHLLNVNGELQNLSGDDIWALLSRDSCGDDV